MYKFFYLLIFLFFFILPVRADFLPTYISKNNLGVGVIALKDNVKIYENNDEKGLPLAIIGVGGFTLRGVNHSIEEDIYIARKKTDNLALLSVEYDTDDWFYVCYNYKLKLYGWVKKDEKTDFIKWEDFFNLYGRKNGLYLFNNLPDEYKKLYSKPDFDSTVVDEFKYPKHISLWLISGDWMLVKVLTYGGETKTGWIKWRTKKGNLTAFPDFRY